MTSTGKKECSAIYEEDGIWIPDSGDGVSCLAASDDIRYQSPIGWEVYYYIVLGDFDFDIPEGYVIDGIIVEAEVSSSSPYGGCKLTPSISGNRGEEYYEQSQQITSGNADVVLTFGSENDSWNIGGSCSMLNEYFRLKIMTRNSYGGARVRLDHVTVEVFYSRWDEGGMQASQIGGDSGRIGMAPYGLLLYDGGTEFKCMVPRFSIEVRDPVERGGALVATPINLVDAGYSESANKAGRLSIKLPPQDPAWDLIIYGMELWLYIKGKLHDIYINWGDERGH